MSKERVTEPDKEVHHDKLLIKLLKKELDQQESLELLLEAV